LDFVGAKGVAVGFGIGKGDREGGLFFDGSGDEVLGRHGNFSKL